MTRPAVPTPATAIAALAALATLACAASRPNVPWRDLAVFVRDDDLSDEFRGSALNLTRWNDISNENPETGCPKWNGPIRGENGEYAVYFAGTTDPADGRRKVFFYKIKKGKLYMKIFRRKLSFFTDRQYYCNPDTRTCNHDTSIDCTAVNFLGQRVTDSDGNFKINHDLCKKEPFCIPHHQFVLGKSSPDYSKYAGPHITSRKAFKYGFVEAKILHANTSAILAVWMSLTSMVDGFCRIRRAEGSNMIREECPSLIRSRRWQEIDMCEIMNSQKQKLRYNANIHAHEMHKGEFSSKLAIENDGGMGGGPIIVRNPGIFTQPRPSFDDVPESQKKQNYWKYGFGPKVELDKEWAAGPRTLGLYWSPNEIRLYLDGEEVERLNNTLIHMPMTFDLSMSLNPPHAGEKPTKQQLRRWAKVYYMRAWKVFTNNGEEPPSTRPLSTRMSAGFQNLYGDQLYGVFNRFPVQDNQTTSIPSNPNPEEVFDPPSSNSGRLLQVDHPDDVAHLLRPRHADYMSSALDELTAQVRQRYNTSMLQPGGSGNRRFIEPVPPPMSPLQKKVAKSREDRFVTVFANGSGIEIIPDASFTAFEDSDSMKSQAGWDGDEFGDVDYDALA